VDRTLHSLSNILYYCLPFRMLRCGSYIEVLHKGEDWVTLSVAFLKREKWGFHTPWSVFSPCLAPKPCGPLQHSSQCALSSRSMYVHSHLQLNPLFSIVYSFFCFVFKSHFDCPVESPNLFYYHAHGATLTEVNDIYLSGKNLIIHIKKFHCM